MSIVDEITRLTSAKANIKAAIEAKGVSVPSSAKLDAFPSYVSAISGGGDGISIDDMIMRNFSTYTNSTVSYIGDYAFANFYPYYAYMSMRSLCAVTFTNVTSIGRYAFQSNVYLSKISFPKVKRIEMAAFANCYSRLTSIDLPVCEFIAKSAFASCTKLTTISLPNAQTVGGFNGTGVVSVYLPKATEILTETFQSCSSLRQINAPVAQAVPYSAFVGCKQLTDVSFPEAKYVGSSAFANCTSLQSISVPNASAIYTQAFYGCTSLVSVTAPLVTYLGGSAFYNCYQMQSVSFPLVSSLGGWAFRYCSALSSAVFPLATYMSSDTFLACRNLSLVALPLLSEMRGGAFSQCFHLISLYLLGDSMCPLLASNTFYSTPIRGYTTSTGGVYGSIFVRASLVESYKQATNWIYFSSRFVGLTDEEIAALPF